MHDPASWNEDVSNSPKFLSSTRRSAQKSIASSRRTVHGPAMGVAGRWQEGLRCGQCCPVQPARMMVGKPQVASDAPSSPKSLSPLASCSVDRASMVISRPRIAECVSIDGA